MSKTNPTEREKAILDCIHIIELGICGDGMIATAKNQQLYVGAQKMIDNNEIRRDLVVEMKELIKRQGWRIYSQKYRDMHPGLFIEAICPHGVGHHKGVHGCDGCCKNCPKDLWKKVSKD